MRVSSFSFNLAKETKRVVYIKRNPAHACAGPVAFSGLRVVAEFEFHRRVTPGVFFELDLHVHAPVGVVGEHVRHPPDIAGIGVGGELDRMAVSDRDERRIAQAGK